MADSTLPNLSTIAASLSTWVAAANSDGILGKLNIDSLKSVIGVVANISVGTAVPATNPGASTGNRMWVASTAGTYTNFSGITIASNEVAFLVDTGTGYSKVTIPIDISGKADASTVAALTTTVAGKADTSTVTALNTTVTTLDGNTYKKTDIDARIPITDNNTYPFYITDNVSRCAFAINNAGAVAIVKFLSNIISGTALTDGTVPKAKLDTSVLNSLGVDLPSSSGFLYAITDLNDRVVFGITTDYKIYGRMSFTGLEDGSIPYSKLSPDVTKYLNSGNPNDRDFSDTDDDGYHTTEGEVTTQIFSGAMFEHMPPVKTRFLYGVNTSGVSLDVRFRVPLAIKGRLNRGNFVLNNTITDLVRVGYVSPTRPLPASTAGLTAGDYYQVYSTDANSYVTTGSLTVYRGDLVVFNGTAFVVKPGPFRGVTGAINEFFVVTQAGTFDGTTYAVGDKIILIGINSAGADGRYYFLTKGKAGDNFFMGEFVPLGFSTPANTATGDLYQASAGGMFDSKMFVVGDYLIRYGTTWGIVANNTIRTIANGEYFAYTVRNAADLEVRRNDKATTVTNLTVNVRINQEQVPYKEDIRIWGDSMSTPFGEQFATYSNRPFKVTNMGGATSNDILSMFRRETLLTKDDDGKTFVFVHGQNDGTDIAQLKEASLEMLNLVGSRNRRYIFVSTLGQRDATWNGTRLVVSAQEGAKAGTNYIYQTEQWYLAMMPGHLFNFRLQMATKATALVDPQNPGMTELQVYNTYGILPFSFWFDYSAAGFQPNQLTYISTWSSAGLPTGGSDLNYYIRISNGSIGNLIVNRAGTWVEYSYDRIHLNTTARGYYMDLFTQFLTANKF